MARAANAEEVYTFVESGCTVDSGIVLGIDDSTIDLLNLDGHYKEIPRASVKALVIHNVIENPIPLVHVTRELNDRAEKVVMADKENTEFVGWPVRFVENLVIYHDLGGKSHVVELDNVDKIRPYKIRGSVLSAQGTVPRLALGDVASVIEKSCPNRSSANQGIIPTRTLSDPIQIGEFLSDFQKGFERIDGFRERTYLYARPFLFERETKLGIDFTQPVLVPSSPAFYVQWSTGQAYQFQSFIQLGTAPDEYTPTIDPLFLVRSDVKSHFFHASFVGNLQYLSAGTDAFDQGAAINLRNHFNRTSFSAESFNYMALMGGDWGPWSFSFGTFYPDIFLASGTSVRDILASSVSPIYRIMFTTRKLQVRALFSPTHVSDNSPTSKDLVVEETNDVTSLIHDFSYSGYFARVGTTYRILDDFELGADQIMLHGNYTDDLIGSGSDSFKYDQYITEVSVRHWFGRYVTLKLIGDWINIQNSSGFSGPVRTENINTTRLGGVFEFVF